MKQKSYIVYAIVALLLLQCYVGSTIASERRWKREHLPKLRKNAHANKALQEAFNEFGEETFEFVPIEIVQNLEDLPEREKAWISELKTLNAVFNDKVSGSPGSRGKKLSAETRRKQSLAKRGERHPDNRKDFAFIAPDGTLHRPHGLKEFCNQFGLSVSGMCRVFGQKQETSKGWRRAEGNLV